MLGMCEGKLVLLCTHPEGHNNIQDKYKSYEFVIVGMHHEPNVYYIVPGINLQLMTTLRNQGPGRKEPPGPNALKSPS